MTAGPRAMNGQGRVGDYVAGAGIAGFGYCLCSPRTSCPVVQDTHRVRASAGWGRSDRTWWEMPHASFNLKDLPATTVRAADDPVPARMLT